jgi:hypothetical protein
MNIDPPAFADTPVLKENTIIPGVKNFYTVTIGVITLIALVPMFLNSGYRPSGVHADAYR